MEAEADSFIRMKCLARSTKIRMESTILLIGAFASLLSTQVSNSRTQLPISFTLV